MWDKIDEKVITPIGLAIVYVFDFFVKRFGNAIGKKIECRVGDHDWVVINENKRYCSKCGIVDDVNINGIENQKKTKWQLKKEKREYEKSLLKKERDALAKEEFPNED